MRAATRRPPAPSSSWAASRATARSRSRNSDCARAPVLALNEPPPATPMPPNVYHRLALARARSAPGGAPRRGRRPALGDRHPLALAARRTRVQEAFEREWTRAGGRSPRRVCVQRTHRRTRPLVRERLAGVNARHGVPRPRRAGGACRAPVRLRDAPGLRDLVQREPARRGHRQRGPAGCALCGDALVRPARPSRRHGLSRSPRPALSVDQERLYAFGIDAFRIGAAAAAGRPQGRRWMASPARITLEGQSLRAHPGAGGSGWRPRHPAARRRDRHRAPRRRRRRAARRKIAPRVSSRARACASWRAITAPAWARSTSSRAMAATARVRGSAHALARPLRRRARRASIARKRRAHHRGRAPLPHAPAAASRRAASTW